MEVTSNGCHSCHNLLHFPELSSTSSKFLSMQEEIEGKLVLNISSGTARQIVGLMALIVHDRSRVD